MKEETFLGAGGARIFARSWRAERPRAVIVIVHGFNSHSGQYRWAAEQLRDHGFAVYALDLRGRGKSEGERFYVDSVADYVADVKSFVTIAKAREPGLPVFVLGHSAGGVVSCIYTLENQAEIAGLICEDFALEVPAPKLVLSALKGLSHVLPHTHLYKLKNEDFSRDPQVVEQLNNDPLIENESQPAQTAAAILDASERLKREFPLITLPLLILHGTDDKVAQASGSQLFYAQAGSRDKTLNLYEGHYHDLLSDIGKEGVMADIQDWIDARIEPARQTALRAA
jgi:acylglycerol lipase